MDFWIPVTILQLIKFTSGNDMIIPVAVEPQKKKDLNINLEVNLGIGGNCTALEILRGNCTSNPDNSGTAMVFTLIKPGTTAKRKFEKYGEYVKVQLCSYEYDDAKTCRDLCSLLGYVKFACSDLELCHCWQKSDQPATTPKWPFPTIRPKNPTPENPQTERSTQGVLVWVDQCGSNACADYCFSHGYYTSECVDNENCHCYNPKPLKTTTSASVTCTVFSGIDLPCLDHCHKKGFDSSRCLEDGTCKCYNDSEVVAGGIAIKTSCTKNEHCADYCAGVNYNRYKCLDNHTCHCYKGPEASTGPVGVKVSMSCTDTKRCSAYCARSGFGSSKCQADLCQCYGKPPRKASPYPNEYKGEYVAMRIGCQTHTGGCMKVCEVLGYKEHECSDSKTCHCIGELTKVNMGDFLLGYEYDELGEPTPTPDPGITIKKSCSKDKHCKLFCAGVNYNRYKCLNSNSCHCYDGPEASTDTVREVVSMSCTDTKQCSAHCARSGFGSFECLHDKCRCYGEPPQKASANQGEYEGEYVDLDRNCQTHTGDCAKKCEVLGFKEHECSDSETCHCFGAKVAKGR